MCRAFLSYESWIKIHISSKFPSTLLQLMKLNSFVLGHFMLVLGVVLGLSVGSRWFLVFRHTLWIPITTKFDTVIIIGEVFEINMFQEVTHIPRPTTSPLPHQPPVSLSHKHSRDETTVWRNDWLDTNHKTWLACSYCHFLMDAATRVTIKKCQRTRLAVDRSSG